MNNSIQRIFQVVLTVAAVTSCGQSGAPDTATGADSVYRNGRIYTVDANRSWAQAVAITDGRITYVGPDDGATQYIGSNTTVVDLGGRMMLPAFQDIHIHPISGGMEASACDLNGLDGLTEYRSTIGEYAAANPDVPWILGGGWSMPVFGPGGAPSRTILDELVPDRPVYLSSADGHTGWANSKALDIAGITKDTPDPIDGRIDRDPETGELIGSLQEGAMSLVRRHIPPTTLEGRMAGLRYARDMLHRYGITSITDASVRPDGLEAYEALDQRGELNLRVITSLWWDRARDESQIPELLEHREKYTKGNIRATTVKIMQDGVLENYTGAMLEPYLLGGGTRGIPMVEPEFLKQAVTLLDAAGFQVHFHAIGDGAIRQCLDAVEEALIENGDLGHRHHISHLQIIHPDDIARFAELKVVANFQPLWAAYDDYIKELNIPAIGEERTSWMYPIQSIKDAGGMVAFGSDWSVSTANPFYQMETAITRMDSNDYSIDPFIPEEAVSVETAIDAFTINAAFVNKHEDLTGSIEPGKYADLIVLDQNLMEIDARAISDTEVLLTLFAGEPVHGSLADL
jgi:predicted amidohydrolase YtcJ